MKFEYHTKGTCSRNIILEMDGDTIQSVQFIGGCNGNLKGIAALVQGQKAQDVILRIQGITCGPKPTSCPDQLALALQAYRNKDNFLYTTTDTIKRRGLCDRFFIVLLVFLWGSALMSTLILVRHRQHPACRQFAWAVENDSDIKIAPDFSSKSSLPRLEPSEEEILLYFKHKQCCNWKKPAAWVNSWGHRFCVYRKTCHRSS